MKTFVKIMEWLSMLGIILGVAADNIYLTGFSVGILASIYYDKINKI